MPPWTPQYFAASTQLATNRSITSGHGFDARFIFREYTTQRDQLARPNQLPAIAKQFDHVVTTPPSALGREEGASRFAGVPTAHPSPKALPEPKDVFGCVFVSVKNESACGARMNANVELLGNDGSASAAALGSAAWIHSDELAAGAFSLARENRDELCPRGVVNLFGEHAGRKTADVEVLDGNALESFDKVCGYLVLEIESGTSDAVVLLG
jgi:hypothetical protein